MKKLLSVALVSGALAFTPVAVQADTSGGEAIPATCNAPVTSGDTGGTAVLTVTCAVGGRVVAQRADSNDGTLRVTAKHRRNGEVVQKMVLVKRVSIGKVYKMKTRTLRYAGTYQVKIVFRPDKDTRFSRTVTRSKIRAS